MQSFPNKSNKLDAVLKPFFKNSTNTILQGGTPWATQILNNVILWWYPIVHKNSVGEKNKTFYPPFFG